MSNTPYKDGQKSFRNGYDQNPYRDGYKLFDWQRGYDEAESAERGEQEAKSERWNSLWRVPESSRDAFIEMADSIGEDGAEKILAFVEVMLESTQVDAVSA